jgi:pilus assembly protein CpaF
MQTPQRKRPARTEEYYDTKAQVFSALIDTIDLSQLAKLDGEIDLRAGRAARGYLQ